MQDHAYALLQAAEFAGKHRLVQVRNPWGKSKQTDEIYIFMYICCNVSNPDPSKGQFEWCGDWSDNSALWTPELKSLARMFSFLLRIE